MYYSKRSAFIKSFLDPRKLSTLAFSIILFNLYILLCTPILVQKKLVPLQKNYEMDLLK